MVVSPQEFQRVRVRPYFYDDFLRSVIGTNWVTNTTGSGVLEIANVVNGVCRLSTGMAADSTAEIYNGNAFHLLYDPGNNPILEEIIRLPGSLSNLIAWFGLSTLDGLNHIMWCARPALSGNFRCESMVGGVTHFHNSGVALDNAWHLFRIETIHGTIKFSIDGVEVWNTTEIPTTLMCLEYYLTNPGVAEWKDLDIDCILIEHDR